MLQLLVAAATLTVLSMLQDIMVSTVNANMKLDENDPPWTDTSLVKYGPARTR